MCLFGIQAPRRKSKNEHFHREHWALSRPRKNVSLHEIDRLLAVHCIPLRGLLISLIFTLFISVDVENCRYPNAAFHMRAFDLCVESRNWNATQFFSFILWFSAAIAFGSQLRTRHCVANVYLLLCAICVRIFSSFWAERSPLTPDETTFDTIYCAT